MDNPGLSRDVADIEVSAVQSLTYGWAWPVDFTVDFDGLLISQGIRVEKDGKKFR